MIKGSRGYTWKADVYSAGVILGMLLHHRASEIDMEDGYAENWSNPQNGLCEDKFYGDTHAQSLMCQMLRKNPRKRPDHATCLAHPFFHVIHQK